MGQYYRALTQKENKRYTVYNRDVIVDGEPEYTVAKLLEHSWWLNDFVNAVCKDIYDAGKLRVAWIGDYADDYVDNFGELNGLTKKKIHRLAEYCWKSDGIAVMPSDFLLEGKYLVNYTKDVYVDCDRYFEHSKKLWNNEVWTIHPLSILTCIGNGLGGGDFTYTTEDTTTDLIGAWAWDFIGIVDEKPTELYEIDVIFKER